MTVSELLLKYPTRVPVCIKPKDDKSGYIDKTRYLIPREMTLGGFIKYIRDRISLKAHEAIFVFINNVLPPMTSTFDSLYSQYADNDQMLYVVFSTENTFG